MRDDAMSGIDSDRESAFAVVSRVVPRNPAGAGRPDPLAFGTAITPLFYARVAAGAVDVFELPPDKFHPEFSRIRF
jgi:hypothetical protein